MVKLDDRRMLQEFSEEFQLKKQMIFQDDIDARRKYNLDKFQYGITKDTFNSF